MAAFAFHPTIIRQVLLGMGRNGYHSWRGKRVWPFAGVVVTVSATVAVHSVTKASVDVNGVGGLVLDLHEVHAILLVVIDGIFDPFLQEVYFDVIVRHQRIGLDAEDGGKVFRLGAVSHQRLHQFVAEMAAIVSSDDFLVVLVRPHVNHFPRLLLRHCCRGA